MGTASMIFYKSSFGHDYMLRITAFLGILSIIILNRQFCLFNGLALWHEKTKGTDRNR